LAIAFSRKLKNAMGELSNSGRRHDPGGVSACLSLVEGERFQMDNPKGASIVVTTQMQSL
jgi:hypothetical protein